MRGWLGLGLALLTGCGMPPDEFVPSYAESYCTYFMECSDPAELTFDGVLSIDDCLAVVGPDLDAQLAACDYSRGAAKDCLDAMAIATCPAEGEALDAGLPQQCGFVFTECLAIAEDTDTQRGDE